MRNALVPTLVAVLWLVAVTPARAQQGGGIPVERAQVISASPILLIAKWFNVDYERRINSTTTWGVSGSYLPVEDFNYGRVTLVIRYYPQGAALTGFYLGAQSGLYRIADASERELLYGAGFDIGHAWLLGSKRNVGVSVGLGLSRVFGAGLDGASLVMPNARLVNVGIAF